MRNEGNSTARTRAYVLDSFALLAFLEKETGNDYVTELLEKSMKAECHLYMCVVNVGEVIYIVERERGLPLAQEIAARINELPIDVIGADIQLSLSAAHIKSSCPIAFADCYAAALSLAKNAILVTGDPEFRKIKPEFNLKVAWLTGKTV